MNGSLILLAVITLMLAAVIYRRCPERLPDILTDVRDSGGNLLLRIPLAIFASICLSSFVPPELVGSLIGANSGWQGILLASFLGGFTPGGSMVTFPFALTIWQMGAGEAQMIGFLAAWSILAFHRIISYEVPFMGGRFVAVRLLSSWMLPPTAGLIAALLMTVLRRGGIAS